MKQHHIYSFYIFLVFLSLTGCAKINVQTDYQLQQDKQVGLLVMSVTHNTRAVTLHYENMDNHADDVIMTSTIHDKIDFTQPKGRLVVSELPVGKYHIYQWQTDVDGFHYTSPLLSIPFTIEQGKAVYIGGMNINAKVIYPFMKVEYEHVIKDKSERDLALLKKKYPKLDISNLKVNISNVMPSIIFQRK